MNAETEHQIAPNEPHRAPNEPEVTRMWREIEALENLDVAGLKTRYLELFGEAAPGRHRQSLVRRIAWRLQAQAEGDLSERARQRAAAIARRRPASDRSPFATRWVPTLTTWRSRRATSGARHDSDPAL